MSYELEALSSGFPEGFRGYNKEMVDEYVKQVNTRLNVLQLDLNAANVRADRLQSEMEKAGTETPDVRDKEHSIAAALIAAVEHRNQVEEQMEKARAEAEAKQSELLAAAQKKMDEAGPHAEKILSAAKAEAESLVRNATKDSEARRQSARDEADLMLQNAHQEAQAMVTASKAQAEEIRRSASDEVENAVRNARAKAQESIGDLQLEMQRLEAQYAAMVSEMRKMLEAQLNRLPAASEFSGAALEGGSGEHSLHALGAG